MAEKRTIYLDDWTRNRQGTLEEVIHTDQHGDPIEPNPKADVDEVCKIRYNPSVTPKDGFLTWLKTLIPVLDSTKITEQKFPAESVYQHTNNIGNGNLPGEPREVLIIEEDQYGNSPYSDDVDKTRETRISTIQGQRDNYKTTSQRKDIENLDKEQEEDDDYKRGKGTPRDEFFDDDRGIRNR